MSEKGSKNQTIKQDSPPQLSFSSFFTFLKSIQDSFVLRTAKTFDDKVKILQNLKDKLMMNIDQRIQELFPTKANRKKRSTPGWMMEKEGGGMDFPSAEGALMTISFLTFAVFLIKLVLVNISYFYVIYDLSNM